MTDTKNENAGQNNGGDVKQAGASDNGAGGQDNGKKQDAGAVDSGAVDGKAQPWARPKDLPDHLYDDDPAKAVEKVLKAYSGARDELAKNKDKAAGDFPEKLDDYSIALPDELASKILQPGEDGKDPIWEHMRAVFHSHKIPADVAIGLAQEFYGKVAELMGDGAGGDGGADVGFEAFGGADKAKPLIDANTAWITGLKNKGVIDDADVEEMTALTTYGQGLRFMDKLRVHSGEKSIPVNMNGGSGGAMSEADLHAMMKDDRYWKPGKKDPEFIKQVTEGFQKLYGGAA